MKALVVVMMLAAGCASEASPDRILYYYAESVNFSNVPTDDPSFAMGTMKAGWDGARFVAPPGPGEQFDLAFEDAGGSFHFSAPTSVVLADDIGTMVGATVESESFGWGAVRCSQWTGAVEMKPGRWWELNLNLRCKANSEIMLVGYWGAYATDSDR